MSWWWWSHRASLGTGSGRSRPAAGGEERCGEDCVRLLTSESVFKRWADIAVCSVIYTTTKVK